MSGIPQQTSKDAYADHTRLTFRFFRALGIFAAGACLILYALQLNGKFSDNAAPASRPQIVKLDAETGQPVEPAATPAAAPASPESTGWLYRNLGPKGMVYATAGLGLILMLIGGPLTAKRWRTVQQSKRAINGQFK